ncbi:MAG: hypothetical protein ACI9XC_000937 [Gammaproteobacteria bacterium]|jgi:uncharacterized protein YdcH (DUF465 family)
MFENDREIVNSLLVGNMDFKRLYTKHSKLEQELEQAFNKNDDTTLGKIKKEKLHIKDKMATLVEKHREINTV